MQRLWGGRKVFKTGKKAGVVGDSELGEESRVIVLETMVRSY